MAPKLYWTNQAREDLLDIYVLIGLEQPAADASPPTVMPAKAGIQ